MNNAINYLSHPERFILELGRRKHLSWMPDKMYLKLIYRLRFGKPLNLDAPQTFNEKLQWLKIHYRIPEMVTQVDKYAVKDYVAKLIGSEYIIPTIGVWKSVEDIDFAKLPNRFVLKCTHDSGGNIICQNKASLDINTAKHKLKRCMGYNAFWYGREWPYKSVEPKILAEEYMEDGEGKGELTDYKLHFFSGECKAIMVGQNRYGPNGLENDYYTPTWEHFNFTRGKSHNASVPLPRPEKLDEMICLGKIIAKEYPFVRIDFYVINNRVYFGEITFYPASGFNRFHPDKWDAVYGEWIKLPKESRN